MMRNYIGIAFFTAGSAGGLVAYSLRHLPLGIGAAFVCCLGVWFIHVHKRERELALVASDVSEGPSPWRLWPRREFADEGGGFDLDAPDGD